MADRLIQDREHEVDVRRRDVHRRREAEGLTPEAAFAEEQSQFAGVLDNLRTLVLSRFLRRMVFNKLEAA